MSIYLMVALAFSCCLGVTSAITNVLPSTTDNDGADLVTLQIERSQIGLLNDAQYDHNNWPFTSYQLTEIFDIGGAKAQLLDHLDSQVSSNDLHTLTNLEDASNSAELLGDNKSPLKQKLIISALNATPERFFNTSPNLILTTDEKVVNVNIMASSQSKSFLSNVGRFMRDLYKVNPKNQNSVFNRKEEQQIRRISSHNDRSNSFSGFISQLRFINPSFRCVQLEDSTEVKSMRSKYNQKDEEYSESADKEPCPLQEDIVIKMGNNVLEDQIAFKNYDETILKQHNKGKFGQISTDSGCTKLIGSVSDLSLKEKLLSQDNHSEVDAIVEDDYYGVPSPAKYHETGKNVPGSALKNVLENILENVPQNVLPMEPVSISFDGSNLIKNNEGALHSMVSTNFEKNQVDECRTNKAIMLENKNKNENINIDKIIEEERKGFQNELDFVTDNGEEVNNRLKHLKIHYDITKKNLFPSISSNEINQKKIQKSEIKSLTLETEENEESEILKKKANSYLSYLSLFSSSTISNLISSFKNHCNSFYLSTALNQNDIISNRQDENYDQFLRSLPISQPSIGYTTSPRTTSTSSYYLRGSVPSQPLSLPCIDLSHPSMTLSLSSSSPSSSSLSTLSLSTREDSDLKRKNSRRKLQVRKKYIREDESNSDTENSLPLSALFRSYFSSSETEPLLSVPRKIKKAIVKKIKNKAVKSRLDSTVNVKKNTATFLASKIIELGDISDKEKVKKEQMVGLTDNEKLKLNQKKSLSIISDVKNDNLIKNDKEKKSNLLRVIRNSDVNPLFGLNEFKEMRKKKHNDPLLMSPYSEVKKSKNRNLKNERKSGRGNPRFDLNEENSNLANTDPILSTQLIELPIPGVTEEERIAEMNRNILIGQEFQSKLMRDTLVIGEVKKAEKHRLREKYEAKAKASEELKFEKQLLDEKIINTLVQADIEWEVAQK